MSLSRRNFVKAAGSSLFLPGSFADASIVVVAAEASGDPLSLPLYNTANMSYLGSFTLPTSTGSIGADSHEGFRYSPEQGGGGIAFNPAGDGGNGSLFIQGTSVNNDKKNFIMAEVDIPTPVIASPAFDYSDFNTASFLQSWAYINGTKNKIDEILGDTGDAPNGNTCTGMMVRGSTIITAHAGLYSNNPTPYGVFVRSTDLTDTTVDGPYAIGSLNQRIVCNGIGGYLPANWQSTFGGATACIGGGGGVSTMNNACFGWGFHFYDHADLTGTGSTQKAGTPAGYFTPIGSSGYSLQDVFAVDWNGMSLHRGTIFLPESRTVIAYGYHGDAFYDTGGVITGGVQGTYSTGGVPRDRFWLFDANDLKDRFDGTTTALNSIAPYATFDMDFSYRNSNGSWIGETANMRSMTWDEDNRTAYILETRGAPNSHPIVHVVSIAA